jgi:thiosulfate reductase cytochrome b subunit
MNRLEAKHPLAIRWMHWINFPVLTMMIWSGMLIYWANDEYEFNFHVGFSEKIGFTLNFHFFPDWFYKKFDLERGLALGMAYHFLFMWFFALNGIAYVTYTALSGEWRYLLPNLKTPREAWDVILHDLRIRKEPLPKAKFNGAQRLAYTGIIAMGAGSLLTGLAIYKPVQFGWLAWVLGGYSWARAEHFLLTIGYVGFFLIHIAQVIKAGWNNFQAMVTGYELVEDEPPIKEPTHV